MATNLKTATSTLEAQQPTGQQHAAPAEISRPIASRHRPDRYLWLCLAALALLLVWCVPLFLCESLNMEAIHYDIIAREMLQGRIVYRDVIDTNFPGVIWTQAAIRGLFGYRSEVLRLFDLGMISATSFLLMKLAAGRDLRVLFGGLAVMLLYYFSTPAIVHCQRDIWMLMPCAAAVSLRVRSLLPHTLSRRAELITLFAEGLAWGIAVWIKPHVIFPALLTWLQAVWIQRAWFRQSVRKLSIDLAAVVAGGLAIGILGCLILVASGSWPHFWDALRNWSVSYLGNGARGSIRLSTTTAWAIFNMPWSLLHVVALPLACYRIYGALRTPPRSLAENSEEATATILAAFYLAWTLQAFVVQLTHEYVIGTSLIVAIPFLTAEFVRFGSPRYVRIAAALFVAACLALHPMLRPTMLANWTACAFHGSSPVVKDRLAIQSSRFCSNHTQWQDLARIEQFLRAKHVRSGEVACWDDLSPSVLIGLQVSPANRFIHASMWLGILPEKQATVVSEVKYCHARYITNNRKLANRLAVPTLPLLDSHTRSSSSPAAKSELPFPWNEPIVFQAGDFVVHEVRSKALKSQAAK